MVVRPDGKDGHAFVPIWCRMFSPMEDFCEKDIAIVEQYGYIAFEQDLYISTQGSARRSRIDGSPGSM